MKKLFNCIRTIPRNIKWWFKNKKIKKLSKNDNKVAQALWKLGQNDGEYFKRLLELSEKYKHTRNNTRKTTVKKKDNLTLLEEIIDFVTKHEETNNAFKNQQNNANQH